MNYCLCCHVLLFPYELFAQLVLSFSFIIIDMMTAQTRISVFRIGTRAIDGAHSPFLSMQVMHTQHSI